MSGLGWQSGRLVTVQTDMPEDIDGILEEVRKIILLGRVQSVTIKDGGPITYQRLVYSGEEVKLGESTQSFAELSALDVVRNVPMEEFEWGSGPPEKQLLWMFLFMASRKWIVTHILLGASTRFWRWLDLRFGPFSEEVILDQFMGARIEKDEKVPEDVFILCGARTRNASIAEIGFTLKGNMVHE